MCCVVCCSPVWQHYIPEYDSFHQRLSGGSVGQYALGGWGGIPPACTPSFCSADAGRGASGQADDFVKRPPSESFWETFRAATPKVSQAMRAIGAICMCPLTTCGCRLTRAGVTTALPQLDELEPAALRAGLPQLSRSSTSLSSCKLPTASCQLRYC